MKPVQIVVFALIVGLLASSCKTMVNNLSGGRLWDSAKETAVQAGPPPDFSNAAPVELTRVEINLPRGTRLGSLRTGLICRKREPLKWQGGKMNISDEVLSNAFREVLQSAGFPGVRGSDSLFEKDVTEDVVYLVGGIIKHLKADVCYPKADSGNLYKIKGESSLTVEWQVYSRSERKVVLEVVTAGSFKGRAVGGEPTSMIVDALADAAKKLLQDKGFQDLVLGVTQVTEDTFDDSVEIAAARVFTKPLKENSNQVRRAVVTISTENGHGSGFFIDPGGLIMTNAHVVAGSRFVTIRLITGTELVGEVIRRHKKRDVALVRAEPGKYPVLPLRADTPQVGQEVFAIGAPFEEELHGTMSQGIVSSHRTHFDLPILQSDVNVQGGNSGGPLVDENGNVVAICVSGVPGARNLSTGINFFIPIQDALEKLNVIVTNP